MPRNARAAMAELTQRTITSGPTLGQPGSLSHAVSAPDKKTGSANLDNSHWPQKAKQSDLTGSDYGSHAVSATDKKTGSVNLGNSHLSQRAKRSDLTGSDPQTQIPLAQSSRVFHQIPYLFPVAIGKIGRNRS